jgi:hypothetical protein
MKNFNQLSRAEMKNVLGGVLDPGGDDSASCTASCGNAPSVTCKGKNCHATSGTGCKSDTDSKSCTKTP